VSPNVGAVVIDEDCDVADNANRTLRTIAAQCPPLLIKCKLQRAPEHDVVHKFLTRFVESGGFASGEFSRPLIPSVQFAVGAQRVKQGEIFEPPCILCSKSFEPATSCGRSRPQKTMRGFKQQWKLLREYPIVFNNAGSWQKGFQLSAVDPAMIGQTFQADQ